MYLVFGREKYKWANLSKTFTVYIYKYTIFVFTAIYFVLRELTSKEVAFYNHYNNLNDKIIVKKSTIEVKFRKKKFNLY